MAADDAVHGGQSQTASGELRGKERVENMFLGFVVHAATGVMHFQAHVHAVRVREPAHTGSDFDKTGTVADCLGSIYNQVHYELLHLARIRLDQREIRWQVQLQLDLPGDGGTNQLADLAYHLGQIDGLDNELTLTRVRKQLPRQFSGAFASPHHVFEHASLRFGRREHFEHEAGI